MFCAVGLGLDTGMTLGIATSSSGGEAGGGVGAAFFGGGPVIAGCSGCCGGDVLGLGVVMFIGG